MPYEDEILKELEEGMTYPESVIYNLIFNNKDVFVISQSCDQFQSQSSREFTVLKKCVAYMHKCNDLGEYCIPLSNKSTVYYVN